MLRVIIVGPVVKCYVTDLFRRSMSFPRHYFFSGFCMKNMGNALVEYVLYQMETLIFTGWTKCLSQIPYPCWNLKIDQLVDLIRANICILILVDLIRANISILILVDLIIATISILILYTVIHSYIFVLIVFLKVSFHFKHRILYAFFFSFKIWPPFSCLVFSWGEETKFMYCTSSQQVQWICCFQGLSATLMYISIIISYFLLKVFLQLY